MNKSELIRALANEAGLTIKDATAAFEGFINVTTAEIKKGEKVNISGFGSFELKVREERDGINPKTGEKIHIAASKAPAFKFGKAYKDSF